MKKRKKRGSALVLVIIFALFFTVIAGVSVLAVTNTFKANGAEQDDESLYYAADSGIEYVTAKANVGEYNSLADEGDVTINLPNNSFDFATVEVKVKKTGDLTDPSLAYDATTNPYTRKYLLATSTSTSKVNSSKIKTITAKVIPTIGIMDIFKYTLCGESLDVNSPGRIDIGSGKVNSANSPANITTEDGSAVPIGSEDNAQFELPALQNINHSNKVPISVASVADLTGQLRSNLKLNSSVKEIEVTTPNQGQYYIYLVNADELELNLPQGIYTNIMIICNGKITVKSGGEILLTKSGFTGKSVEVDGGGTMHLTFAPYNDDTQADMEGLGDSPLSKNNLEKIMNEINTLYSPGFGVGAGSSGVGYEPTEYQ